MFRFIGLAVGILVVDLVFGAPIEIGVGTKSQGMGGAFVGVVDDVSATYWNPAGLGKIGWGEARFMHWILSDVGDVYVDWFSSAYPLGVNLGSIGFGWLRKYAKLEQGRDTLATGMAENTYSLCYGLPIWEYEGRGLYVGGTINRFSIDSDIGSSSGFGLDAGVLWKPIPSFRLGFIARNISANMGDENFPSTYRCGLGWGTDKFMLALDISTKQGVNGKEGMIIHYFGGLSWRIVPQFEIRIGANENNPINADIGFEVKRIILEYAYSSISKPEEGLSQSHRIEFGYKFFELIK